jgi:hypothetical protein
MSFSDALNKAKTAAETEKAREGGARATTAAASRPRNTQEDEEDGEEEEVELRMPGSFAFGDHGGGGARRTPGADTVDPFDAVGVLGNLWRRMQVR